MLPGKRSSFRLLEAAAFIAVTALRAGAQELGKTRSDEGKLSCQRKEAS